MWLRKTNGTDAGHVEHVKSGHNHAGAHHPENHGRVRRLAESFLGPAVTAPYALWDTVLFPGSFNQITVEAKPTQDNIFVAALRYVVFSTIGCYLTEPKVQVVDTQKSSDDDGSETVDGTKLKVLRPDDSWMCFPAIPVMLPTMPTMPPWRQWTKTEGIDYTKLTYEVRSPRLPYSPNVRETDRDVCAPRWSGPGGHQISLWVLTYSCARGASGPDRPT